MATSALSSFSPSSRTASTPDQHGHPPPTGLPFGAPATDSPSVETNTAQPFASIARASSSRLPKHRAAAATDSRVPWDHPCVLTFSPP